MSNAVSQDLSRGKKKARQPTHPAAPKPNGRPDNILYSDAPGRIHGRDGLVGVIDIGSNSVRLVVYERASRAPTPFYNEKDLCGLGRAVATRGRMRASAIDRALTSLRRYRALADNLGVTQLYAIATAAARDAKNGPEFIREAQKICGVEIDVLSGKMEARYASYGIISGFLHADGLVGDLGGGSLELTDVKGRRLRRGDTLAIGGIRLAEMSRNAPQKADQIARAALKAHARKYDSRGRQFYAIGGTWRALARLHIVETGYPLRVMHHYCIRAAEALEFCHMVARAEVETLAGIDAISSARRELLAYGAVAMANIITTFKPREIVFSALGVREGYLYGKLQKRERLRDPLIEAARELGYLRARSPLYGEELYAWTSQALKCLRIDERKEERRLRHAACLLADIGWRAHPDYRGEQSLNIIAHAAFIGIDHPGRAYLAMANYYRHAGLVDRALSPRIVELTSARLRERARVLGAVFRLAYAAAAATPGVLPKLPLKRQGRNLVLGVPKDMAPLIGARLTRRLGRVARLAGLKGDITVRKR